METVTTSKHFHWPGNTTYEEAFDELETAADKIIEEGKVRHKRLISLSHSITQITLSATSFGSSFHWKGSLIIVHEAND